MTSERKKVLIVDDEAYNLRVLKLKLTNAGYDTITASNGVEALEIIRLQQPDVLITDINMPKLSGKELCIRSAPFIKKKDFFIIIITCSLDDDLRSWVKSKEKIVFLEKPYSPKELLKVIEQHFSEKVKL